jgi:uncharacterized membrane protein YccC
MSTMTVERMQRLLRDMRADLAEVHEADPQPVDERLQRLLDEIELRLINRRTVQ